MSAVRCATGLPVGGFTPATCHILTHLCDIMGVWAGPPDVIVIQGISASGVDVAYGEFPPPAKPAFEAKLKDALGPMFLVVVRQRGSEGEHVHIAARV